LYTFVQQVELIVILNTIATKEAITGAFAANTALHWRIRNGVPILLL